MTKLTKAAFETLHNDATTGRYKAGQTDGIGSDDHRAMITDMKDTFLSYEDDADKGTGLPLVLPAQVVTPGLSTFLNGGTGSDWTLGAAPNILLNSSLQLSKYLYGAMAMSNLENYDFKYDFTLAGADAADCQFVQVVALDSGFNELASHLIDTGLVIGNNTGTATLYIPSGTCAYVGIYARASSGTPSVTITINALVPVLNWNMGNKMLGESKHTTDNTLLALVLSNFALGTRRTLWLKKTSASDLVLDLYGYTFYENNTAVTSLTLSGAANDWFEIELFQGSTVTPSLDVRVEVKNQDITDGNVITETITITSSEILSSNSSPITLKSAPGASAFYEVLRISAIMVDGTTLYDTNTNARFLLGAISLLAFQLDGPANRVSAATISQSSADLLNQALTFDTQTGDPATGDYDIKVTITYIKINV